MSAVQNWLETIWNRKVTQGGIQREILLGLVRWIGYFSTWIGYSNKLNWLLE